MDDEQLIRELGQAADIMDPVPGRIVDAAVAGFTLRTLDEELAELAFDAEQAGALVRSEMASSVVSFHSGGLDVELEIIPSAKAARLVGQLLPPSPALIEIRGPESTTSITADHLGRFTATLPPGPVQLRIMPPGCPRPVTTEWFTA